MSKTTPSFSLFQDFTRGGQILLHAFRMMSQVSKHLVKILMLFVLIFNTGWFYNQTSSFERTLLWKWSLATLYVEIHLSDREMTIQPPSGNPITFSASTLANHANIQNKVNQVKSTLLDGLLLSILGCLSLICFTILFFIHSGAKRRISKFRRGSTSQSPKRLRRQLKRENVASHFSLADVPLVKNAETKHILVNGSSGTGKTVAITELLDQIRAKKQRAIVYDKMGTFVSHYYREGKDILLNPLDERCPNWNVWSEGTNPATYDMMASAFVPTPPSHVDKTWVESARILFASVADKLHKTNQANIEHLLAYLLSADLEKLSQFVKGTPAEPLVSEKAEKFAFSVVGTLAPAIKPLQCLTTSNQPSFSIKQWVENEDNDSWLFISSRADQHATLKPLISTWLELATNSLLSLPAAPDRRIWTVIDELPSLQKLPSLFSALAESRQFGGCMLLSIQTIAQLREIYGRDGAESLSGLCSTRLSFRTPDPATAKWVSESLGQSELDETKEGLSYGAHEIRDGVSIHSQTLVRPIVLPAEILALEDLAAFLRLPGAWPITKVHFKPKSRDAMVSPFIAKPFVEHTENNNGSKPIQEQSPKQQARTWDNKGLIEKTPNQQQEHSV